MTRAPRLLAAITIPLTGVPLAAPAHAVIAPPTPSRPLPSALDVAPPYQAQRLCDPGAKPGAKAFGDLMVRHYGTGNYGISRACNFGLTEHSEGRAVDWMISAYNPSQRAIGDSVVQWLTAPDSQGRPGAMARRFGIMYIIWNKKMWRAYAPERGWTSYSGASPHTDHIHFSFTWDGAYGRNSWWTGTALTTYATGPGGWVPTLTTPPPTTTTPTPGDLTAYQNTTLRLWSRGAAVTALQKALGGITADGVFGPMTESKVKAFQSSKGLPSNGVVDTPVWKALIARTGGTTPTTTPTTSGLTAYQSTTLRLWSRGAAVTALQKALGGITADGVFGPMTEAKVKTFQSSKGLPSNGVVDTPVWKALIAAAGGTTTPTTTPTTSGLTAYQSTTLRLWSRGAAVTALQKALGGITADGVFGPMTESKVKAFQSSKGLPSNGVVDAPVWKALIAAAGGTVTSGTTVGTTLTPPAPTTASTKTVYTPHLSTVLRTGSRGEAVKVLQRGIGGVVVDGAYGSRTASAVAAFQKSKGLPGTGVTDSATWKALEARDYPLRAHYGVVVKRASTGAAVTALQRALRIGADGEFGSQTETAVKAAQAKARLAQTGVVATLTWQAIEKQSTGRSY
ncbi:peptidoglycan-binding domain-containing protein [Actinomycetota bacterium]